MKQMAILLNRNNVHIVAAKLTYHTAAHLLEDHGWMLKADQNVVFCADVLDGTWTESYVVTEQMFERNNPGIELNEDTYTFVRNV